MSEEFPAPLVPAEVDLSDFQYMELDVRLLRDSKFAAEAEPEAFRAGVLLWCAAWHQIPAGSLPDNDIELSNLAGFGRVVKEWRKVRAQALMLFVRCSDGRLYHPVICEKALSAWESRLRHQHAKLLERMRKDNKKRETEKLQQLPYPTFDQWNSDRLANGITPEQQSASVGIPAENALKGNGEGTERRGNGDSLLSDAGASAAGAAAGEAGQKAKSPEDMAKAQLWRAAVAVLREGGCKSEDVARSFMGKLVGDYTIEIVRDAVAAAAASQPADAREYLKATCMRLKGERAQDHGKPITVPSRAETETQRLLRERTAHAAEVEASRLRRIAEKQTTGAQAA